MKLSKRTLLAVPDPEDPFESYQVVIDASIYGYGATLSRELVIDGKRERRIVAFYKKTNIESGEPIRTNNVSEGGNNVFGVKNPNYKQVLLHYVFIMLCFPALPFHMSLPKGSRLGHDEM
eukprot:sb/3476194/